MISPTARRSTGGSALVPIVMLLATMLAVSYAFFRSTLSIQARVTASVDDARAHSLAEAGLHEAYQAIRMGRSGGVASTDDPARLGGGVLWVEAKDLGDGRTRLVSTALAGSGRAALESVVQYSEAASPLFEATLNSDEPLTLNEGVVIDSFDSSLGTYVSQQVNVQGTTAHANANGHARSNQDVVLNANAMVMGNAVPGVGYGVEFNTGSYVHGSVEPSSAPFVYPPIVPPSLASAGNYSVATGGTATLSSGTYEFDSFTINKSASLTILGPTTIVVDNFVGGKLAKLAIDATAGPVTIYVRNSYTHTSGFEALPVGSSPMAVAFLIDGTGDIVFPNSAKVRGAYYAPNAEITFSSANECWGAFAAKRISMANDMRFHFDEVLMEHWESDNGDEDDDPLTVLYWNPAPIAVALAADRRDPLQVLGLDAAALRSPDKAWAD